NVSDWQGFESVFVGDNIKFTAIAREVLTDGLEVERFKERWIGVEFHEEGVPADPSKPMPLPQYQIRFRKGDSVLLDTSIALSGGTLQVSKRAGLAYFDPKSAAA